MNMRLVRCRCGEGDVAEDPDLRVRGEHFDGVPCRFVACDEEWCQALRDPVSPRQVTVAYLHWRYHRYMRGCSHGR